MKVLLYRCIVLAISSVASVSARAQDVAGDQSVAFGFMAGIENVTGTIRDATPGIIRPGAAVGALAQFPLTSRRFAVRADVMLHWIHDDVCNGNSGCGVSQNFSYVWSGSVDFVARLNDRATRWSPYVLAGAGAYSYDFADGNIKALHPSHVGLQGGIGFEARPARATIFAEIRYLNISPGGVLPVVLGVRF